MSPWVCPFFSRSAKLAGAILVTGLLVLAVSAQSLTITTLTTLQGADGMVLDVTGNLYVSDSTRFTIRKITPAGIVTTLAGSAGVSGYVDASGTSARFRQPGPIVRDAAGNLYVGDGGRVRKITPDGAVTTLVAGAGLAGSASSGSSANAFNGAAVWVFAGPSALALDAANNLYVAEGSSIRKIGVEGRESEFVGLRSTPGAVDGIGLNARFGSIHALARDGSGNFYVADGINHTIRKISPAGVVTTVAGLAGVIGSVDGSGTTARFNGPKGIALDGAGALLVVEEGAIRRISSTGNVSTVAGGATLPPVFGPDGRAIFSDGIGALARITLGTAVVADSAGVVYFSSIGLLGSIRKGVSVPVAAKVIVSPQSLSAPAAQRASFTVVANGNPIVGYQWQRQVSGKTAWEHVADGPRFSGATTAVLVASDVVATMTGDPFRCVVSNHLGSDASTAAVLRVDLPVVVVPLAVSTLAGRAGTNAGREDGVGGAARFTGPMAVALDVSGNLYVADTFGHRIRKVTAGGVVTTLAGSGTQGSLDGVGAVAQFSWPSGVAVDRTGNVFVADAGNSMIRKITPTGVVTRFAGGVEARPMITRPTAITFDPSGNLLVAAGGFSSILVKITPDGLVSYLPIPQDLLTTGLDALKEASGLAIDGAGNIYIANTEAHTICRFSLLGVLTVVAGKTSVAGAVDGLAANARFKSPAGIAVDPAGNVFVADSGNHTIRKITPAGIVSTVAGVAPSAANVNSWGASDGIGGAARFSQPRGLALDRGGNLYIADALNHTIRRSKVGDAVVVGDPVVLSVVATIDSEPVAYQWRKDSAAIAGATKEIFMIEAVSAADAGDYAVEVGLQGFGSISEAVKVIVGLLGQAPVVPPVGPPLVGPIMPPVVAPLVPPILAPVVPVEPPGARPVAPPVVVPVVPPAPVSRIVNLSIRSEAGQGAGALVVGFVVNGRVPLLVRGVGPSLAQFGVGSTLADPRLSLYAGSTLNLSNDNWGNATDMMDAVARLGAFALAAGSLDAALLTTVGSGSFTAECAGASSAKGIVLVELYDAATTATGRLVNVSARSWVNAGEGILIAGFSISGTASQSVLIRGVGPALAVFGVVDVLADPQLRLLDASGALKAQNDNWADHGAARDVTLVAQSVGAFALADGSKDSAVVATLRPGTYSVQMSGVGGASGVGLIEIYELP